jgi:hypothetical protein
MKNNIQRLSAEAISELRTIYEEEFKEVLTDFELEDMGIRLLRFFHILETEPVKTQMDITPQEKAVLDHIDAEQKAGREATVRGIAQAAGSKSSRTGKRLRDQLTGRGLLK